MRFSPRQSKAIFQWCLIAAATVGHPSVRADAEDRTTAPAGPAEPVFRAGDLIEAKLLHGPDYTIEDQVPVVDDRYLFTLRTTNEPITAHGLGMLQVRLDEMRSLQRAQALDDEPQEMEGVKESIKQTGEGVKGLLKDPGHTIGNIPKGLGRKFKSLTHRDRGGGDTRRQFAAAVECDPETDNPPLKKLLDKLALRRKIGKGAVDVAGFAVTGGAANLAMLVRGAGALRATAEMNEVVRSTPLYKINEQIRDELGTMGVSQDLRERFIEHRDMTTLQRLLFMKQYRRIHLVPGAARLIEMALEVTDRAESLGLIRSIELLAQVHERRPLLGVLESDWLVVKLADGSILCVSSADYLTDSAELRQDVPALRAQFKQEKIALLVAGKASPAARQTLEKQHIRVVEDGDTKALEP